MGNFGQALSDLYNENRDLTNQIKKLENENQQQSQDLRDLDAFLQKRIGMDLKTALEEARTSS